MNQFNGLSYSSHESPVAQSGRVAEARFSVEFSTLKSRFTYILDACESKKKKEGRREDFAERLLDSFTLQQEIASEKQ